MLATSTEPATLLALVFAALFVIGVSAPLPRAAEYGTRSASVVSRARLWLECLRSHSGEWRSVVTHRRRATFAAIAANTLAAVAEEVWFRRLCYGLLAPAGPGFAVAVTTVLFAVVHVSTYGVTVLPLDLAAGALLGWQRAVTGSWTAPALTHVLANLFVLL